MFRSKVIMMAGDGEGALSIARKMETRPATVTKWRGRFARLGLDGLRDAPRPGQRRRYLPDDEKRVLRMLDQSPPPGYAQWNGTLLSQATKLPADFVWKVLRSHGIQLQRRRSWCISTDPQFAQKAADVVGLYLDPPENALVLCIDEKPHIQALERAQGYLKLPNGRAVTGFSHEYNRHGTTTLFAALETATGQVTAGHYQRRRRVEFLDFMNLVVSAHSDREIHVIMDNLSTHKPKRDMWLARHKNVHFHYIPTHASWLNQVEVWFSLLSRYALKGASFTSPNELREAIDRFIAAYNPAAHPFEWTKKVVHPKSPERHYADLCN
ncbi:MAG: putative transposase [Dehalococcoidia bacterium]|nr:putative transposase [Dehalococcoidia bacterium]